MIDSYKVCPLGLYEEILQTYRRDDLPDLDKQVAAIAKLSEMTEDEVLAMPLPDYAEAVRKASFLANECHELPKVAKRYKVAGWTLSPVQDLTKLTAAQYIDAQTYMAKGEDAMAEILSVALVPEGHKYNDGYDIVALQADIRDNLSVADTLALCAFFLAKLAKLTAATLSYTARLLRRSKSRRAAELLTQIEQIQRMILQPAGGGSPT